MPAAKSAWRCVRSSATERALRRTWCGRAGETGIGDDRIESALAASTIACAGRPRRGRPRRNPGFPAHVAQARGGLAAFDDQRRPRDAEAGLRCGFLPMALVGAADLRAALLILELALGFRLRHAHVAQEYPALDQEVGKSGGEKDADRRSEQKSSDCRTRTRCIMTPHTGRRTIAYPTCQGARRGEHSRAGAP